MGAQAQRAAEERETSLTETFGSQTMSAKKIDNDQVAAAAASTELAGGAGFTFEDFVVAYYLTALLRDEGAQGLSGRVVSVAVQRSGHDQPMDDLVIEFDDGHQVRTLGLQVKRSLAISSRNTDFKAVLTAAMEARGKADFNADTEFYGFVSEFVAVGPLRTLHRLIEWAKASPTELDFTRRFEPGGSAAAAERTMRPDLATILGEHSNAAFYRQFVAQKMEGLWDGGDMRAGIVNRLCDISSSNELSDGTLLFDRLCRLVREGAANAKKWTRATLLKEVASAVRLKVSPSYAHDVDVLVSFSRSGIDAIPDDIEGFRVPRAGVEREVSARLRAHRLVNITGLPGCGKSVLLRNIADAALASGPILLLKPDQLVGTNWATFAGQLGLSHHLHELLSEIGAKGTSILFIDGIDRLRTDQKAIVVDILRAIETHSDLADWRVLASSRDQGLEPYRAWFPASFYGSEGIGDVTVSIFSDEEADLLAEQKPSLRRLLHGDGQVQQIARRPFFAAVMARSIGDDEAAPRTEVDLIDAWWSRGGHDAALDNVLLRQRAMLHLAERGVQSLGKGITTRSLPHASLPQIPALETDRIVRGEMGNRSYSFTHDIFFEWVFFRLLLELGPQWVNAIIEAGEPPLLGRVVGLLAQHSLGTNGEWKKGLRLLEGSALRPQWRREWLTAPPFTAAFDDTLQEFEQVVFADDFALLEKVLVWFQAQHTTPSPVILAQPSVADGSTDKLRVADLLGWPSDFTSWERFIRWLLAHKDRLATRLLPMVLEVFGVWQNACADLKHPVSKLIVDAAEGWLIDLEQVKYADDRRFNHGKWDALGGSESVERLETSLRQMLLRAARAFPKPAIAIYDRAVSNKAMREKAYGDLVGYAVILADVAPDRVVAIAKAKILKELPRDRLAREERKRRERLDRLQRLRAIPEYERTPDQQKAIDLASMSMSMFAQNSLRRDEIGIERFGNEYFPPSALEQPFDALFSQKPEHGLELVKVLADHATKGWVQLQELNGHMPIAVQVDFPWGRQRFWGGWEIYSWALGQLAPPALECAFLSLAHWAHKQIEGGRATDDVVREVVESCESYAVLGLALTLAHETWTVSDTTLSLTTCQRLWEHDLARVVQAPTRDIEIPAFGLIDRLKGDKAEAKKYLAGRPSNQRDVRQLAMLFALSSDENIREQFRAALAAFPEDLPFEFEEERSDTGIAAGLREKAERWAGLGDSVNYRRWEDEKQAYIQYEPPGGTTPVQEKRLADATTYLHEQAVLGWATRYLETGAPRDGMTLAGAIAFARDKDTPKLFKQRLDVGNHTAQSVVSVVAACVMRYGDDDAANRDWALGVLSRVETMKELPDQFEGAHIPWHPANHLVVALSELRKRNPTDGKLVERLLALTSHPLDDVAKLAKFALLRDPDIAVSWIVAQLCFDQALSYRPIIRRDGRRDRTTEKKAYAKAQERAKRRLNHNTVEAFDALPDPWAKSSTRRKGRAWEDENNWVDPDPYFYSKEVADLAGEFPLEAWLHSSRTCSLLESALEQWVRWTGEKLMPAGKEHNVSDRAAADTLEWSRALGDMLARVAPLLDKSLMARLIAPFLVEGDAALAVLARFTDRLVCRHVLDAAVIPDGAIELLEVCLERALQDRVFRRGWRAGELHGFDLPQILDALLFVNVESAPLSARFVNGDWSQIAIIMPLVSRIVEQIGWSTAVAGRFLTLCERAGTAYPMALFADQANAILRVTGLDQERWAGTFLPARMASVVRRLAEANYPLEQDTAKRLLTVLDGLVDLGDRRSAALEQSEAFRRVQGSFS